MIAMLPQRRPKVPFDRAACAQFAADAFAFPPPFPHIVRPEPVGRLVASFVLPLDVLRPQNRTRHAAGWALAKVKRECHMRMLGQCGPVRTPLPGRPMVLCTRFSSVEPDYDNAGFKIAVDRLLPGPMGLGLIANDRPSDIDRHDWWEPAKRGMGFGLVRVFTGAEIGVVAR